MPPKINSICSRILRPMYTRNICWFMANIVVIFYSQRSRSIVMNRSYLWDNKGSIYSLFKKVLYDRYLTVGHLRQSDEYKDFKDDIFIDMLRILHQMNNTKFVYNPDKYDVGFFEYYYLGKLYTLLGIDYKMFDFDQSSMNFSYSIFNREYDDFVRLKLVSEETSFWRCEGDEIDINVYKDNGLAPNILIINVSPTQLFHQYKNNIIDDMEIRPNLTTMADEIEYNGYMYILDSVILTNFNNVPPMSHYIVGMTCKKKKYIYNGVPYMGNRGHPCHLIKHDWNIRSDKDFYLSDNDCVMHARPKYFGGFSERCFNFSKGRRILIYVRKNGFGTSSSKETDIAKYQNLLIQRKAFEKKREEEEYAARLAFEIASALKQTEARRLSAERKEAEARRLSAERKEAEARRLSAERKEVARRLSLERKEAEARRLSAERKEAEARRLSAERKEVARRLLAERKEVVKRKRINYEIDDLANIIKGLKLRSPRKKQEKGNIEIIPKPKAKAKANLKAKAKTRAKVNPKAKAKANLKNKIERIIKKQKLKSRSS